MSTEYQSNLGRDAGLAKLDTREETKRRLKVNESRLDAVAPAKGMHLARQLEYVFNEVLREKYAPLNALNLFPIDSRVPEGAQTYTIRRIAHQGQARYHRANNHDIPRVGASQDEESRPVRHVVTMIEMDYFENLSSGFASSNLRGELNFAANRTMDEFLNRKIWTGDDTNDVYGVLNYPYVPKTVSSVAIASGTAADTILAELHRLANNASEISDTVFSPNCLLMPQRQYNYITTTKRSTTTDQTILQAFLQDQPFINEVLPIPELSGQGVAGAMDVMLFYRKDDSMSVANVIPKGVTMLPVQLDNFSMKIPVYMTHGGVVMRDPLNNLVCYTPAT